jgi:hypothetical protein
MQKPAQVLSFFEGWFDPIESAVRAGRRRKVHPLASGSAGHNLHGSRLPDAPRANGNPSHAAPAGRNQRSIPAEQDARR